MGGGGGGGDREGLGKDGREEGEEVCFLFVHGTSILLSFIICSTWVWGIKPCIYVYPT